MNQDLFHCPVSRSFVVTHLKFVQFESHPLPIREDKYLCPFNIQEFSFDKILKLNIFFGPVMNQYKFLRLKYFKFLIKSRSPFFAYFFLASCLFAETHENPSLSLLIVENNIEMIFIQAAFFWCCKPVFVDYCCFKNYNN